MTVGLAPYEWGRADAGEGKSRSSNPCVALENRHAWEAGYDSVTAHPIGSGDFAFGSKVWPGLAKLIEECGEMLQIAGKLMQRGGRTDHWSGDLEPMAEHEIADVIAAAETFIGLNEDRLDTEAIWQRVAEKKATFRKWHRDNLGNPAS